MVAHVLRLRFSLDPLIAEAKRRARRRRVQLVMMACVLVAAAAAATIAFTPIGLVATGHGYAGPYVPGGMFQGVGGPMPMQEVGGTVSTVSVASSSDAWAVGSIAWHWDGHAWRNVPLPRVSAANLWAVAADRADDAWAVGARGNGNLTRSMALVEHWDGAHWRVASLPRLPASYLFGISTAGPRSAWAVGGTFARNRAGRFVSSMSRPLLLHWDGRSWHEQSLPWASPGLVLDTVVATGPSSVWAIASGQQDSGRPVVMEYWNGVSWRAAPSPFGAKDPFGGFSATAWDDAWAVGAYGQGGNEVTKFSHALAAHWNGHRWQMTPLPNPQSNDNSFALMSVTAARPDYVIALGEMQSLTMQGNNGVSATGPVSYFLRWNGQNWQVMPGTTPPIYEGFPAVSAGRDGSAWMVGNCQQDDFLVRLTADGWVTAPHPIDAHWAPGRGTPHGLPSCSPQG